MPATRPACPRPNPGPRLSAEPPVTIEQAIYGERWFPFVFRAPDGTLFLYIEYGHDAHFSPVFRLESRDNGATWCNPTDHVPRASWCLPFKDGELFEVDTYGVHDPKTRADAVFYGAWSRPGRPNDAPRRDWVRVRHSTQEKICLTQQQGYPTHPWWNLWNTLHGTDQLSGSEVFLNGPYFTDGLELEDGRLLAVGYRSHVILYVSDDRGRTWDEMSVLNDPAVSAITANETALARLADGRLYAVCRTERSDAPGGYGPLMHTWSEDLGRTWSRLAPLTLADDPAHRPAYAWPRLCRLASGGLVLAYGRPGKNLVFDPSGTGTQWQGRFDLHQWELDAQSARGVPPEQRLRGMVPGSLPGLGRHTDSSDYLAVVETAPGELLIFYDVQGYVEHPRAKPCSAVRMMRLGVE
jgi:hypothetical protein